MKLLKVYSKTCGPFKVLERNLKQSGIEYINIDVDSEEGEKISDKYEVTMVPTLLLLDDNDNLIKKNTGILNVEGIKNFINNEV